MAISIQSTASSVALPASTSWMRRSLIHPQSQGRPMLCQRFSPRPGITPAPMPKPGLFRSSVRPNITRVLCRLERCRTRPSTPHSNSPLPTTSAKPTAPCTAMSDARKSMRWIASYAPDLSKNPYIVTGSNFYIRLVQPKVGQEYAVCFVHASEDISWHYEHNPADPRISHALTLAVDAF